MICNNCKREWAVAPGKPASVFCPFCGEKLSESIEISEAKEVPQSNAAPQSKEISDIDDPKDAFQQIKRQFGMEAFDNKSKIVSLFGDFAPRLQKEKKLIITAYNEDIYSTLKKAGALSESEKEIATKKAVRKLIENAWLSEIAARSVVGYFVSVLEWEISFLVESPVPEENVAETRHDSRGAPQEKQAQQTAAGRNAQQAPDPITERTNTGYSLLKLRQYDKAYAMFDEVLQFAPNSSRAWWGLVLAGTENFMYYGNGIFKTEALNAIKYTTDRDEIKRMRSLYNDFIARVNENLDNKYSDTWKTQY